MGTQTFFAESYFSNFEEAANLAKIKHTKMSRYTVCKRDGITENQTNEQTDQRMDNRITRCPQRTFQAGA